MEQVPDPATKGLKCEPNQIKCTVTLDLQIEANNYFKW